MMKMLILGGKAITLFFWVMMIYNLIMPFNGNISNLLNFLFFTMLAMHSLQVLMFHNLFKSLMKIENKHYLSVLIFGAFSLLAYRREVLNKHSS